MSDRARAASAFAVGLSFGLGLVLAGMTDPWKVRAFLDLAGPWDPSLAFVMGGAIPVTAIGFALARRRERALLGDAMPVLPRGGVDRSLLVGSALFGLGWGIAGFCPGPALVALGTGSVRALLFVAAMVTGSLLVDRLGARRGASSLEESRSIS